MSLVRSATNGTDQNRCGVAKIGIDLEDRLYHKGIVNAEQILGKVPLNSILQKRLIRTSHKSALLSESHLQLMVKPVCIPQLCPTRRTPAFSPPRVCVRPSPVTTVK